MTFNEARIHALVVRSRAVATEVIAMQAHDRSTDQPYTEEAYLRCSNELYSISDQIEAIARSGEPL